MEIDIFARPDGYVHTPTGDLQLTLGHGLSECGAVIGDGSPSA
jgi:hypothetical protein